jgi:hypothetical protein
MNEKVLSRQETLEYLYDKFQNKERLLVSRYNDGEFLLMNGRESDITRKIIGEGSYKVLETLLHNSIKDTRQFICINYLKPKNIENKDMWYNTQQYLIEQSNREIYGCGNWLIEDFCKENKLLPYLFSDETMVVSGIVKYFKPVIELYNKKLYYYETLNLNVEKDYISIREDLIKLSNQFKNIILACGPLSKVLLVDLIDKCNANLVDVGSIINAICGKESIWAMSWTKNIDMKKCRDNFLSKIT